jgi:DNA-binding NtrC family response regulator/predicted hydrocarbon binding protein
MTWTHAGGPAPFTGPPAPPYVASSDSALRLQCDQAEMLPQNVARLQLAELLDFRPDLGIIRLHDQRVLILSAAAMGLMKKELIDTFGRDVARRLMLRFGYADGFHDAVNMRDRSRGEDPMDAIRAGAVLYTLEGIARVEIVRLERDDTGRFDAEVIWHESYTAEQHLHHYGTSEEPVCWSLAGYATGYASACLGQEVYFRETACLAQGAKRCTVIGRDAAAWGSEVDELRADFQSASLAEEVQRLHSAVRRQAQELAKRERLLERRERELNLLRERINRHAEAHHFVARSPAMQEVLELAGQVAPLDTTVLVVGESGTGKEFVVKMIHEQSRRANGAFVSINCAALTETLLESELFGHVRGAFTGAMRDKPGLFEVASNGTLFLDEVGEVAPSVQAKLLRALQEREIRRVGGERTIKVNTRVVAATNRDLRAAVTAGTFREDLYFRLSAFVIPIPPLRDRREDIPVLAHQFVQRAAARMEKDVRTVSADAMTLLVNYAWPGNVRELEHAIERGVILARGTTVSVRELPPEIVEGRAGIRTTDTLDLKKNEQRLIRQALEKFKGNRKRAADALKISPVTLWRKMKEYGLSEE